jgi:hypothetical protein
MPFAALMHVIPLDSGVTSFENTHVSERPLIHSDLEVLSADDVATGN